MSRERSKRELKQTREIAGHYSETMMNVQLAAIDSTFEYRAGWLQTGHGIAKEETNTNVDEFQRMMEQQNTY